jgi:hypothetical protein
MSGCDLNAVIDRGLSWKLPFMDIAAQGHRRSWKPREVAPSRFFGSVAADTASPYNS